MSDRIRFVLDGCDISFTAEAPEDITLKQLLKQTDKIEPDWCACGICSYEKAGFRSDHEPEIIIDSRNRKGKRYHHSIQQVRKTEQEVIIIKKYYRIKVENIKTGEHDTYVSLKQNDAPKRWKRIGVFGSFELPDDEEFDFLWQAKHFLKIY